MNGANMWNFDIQGAELMALKGAGDLIKGAEVLYLEVNREPIYAGCALIDELDAWCDERGFVRVATVWTRAEWGDAVYIRKEFTGGDGAPRNRVETGPPPRRQSPTGRETVSIKPGQILRLS